MAIKRNALGRGLDSLISMDDVQPSGSSAINEIAIDLIKPNPDQPRINFDEEALEELATSIRELGIIQPLTLPIRSLNRSWVRLYWSMSLRKVSAISMALRSSR